jgi:hypothetical protein
MRSGHDVDMEKDATAADEPMLEGQVELRLAKPPSE